MKNMKYLSAFFFVLVSFTCVERAAAQENRSTDVPSGPEQRQAVERFRGDRGHMLRQLGLLDEQIEQIRKLNAEKAPLLGEATKRLRETTRALDEAIYADQLNETNLALRLKEVELARATLARLRYENEIAFRRILTSEQLNRFRELRQKFEKRRQGPEKMRRYQIDRGRPAKDTPPATDEQPQRPFQPKTVL